MDFMGFSQEIWGKISDFPGISRFSEENREIPSFLRPVKGVFHISHENIRVSHCTFFWGGGGVPSGAAASLVRCVPWHQSSLTVVPEGLRPSCTPFAPLVILIELT